KRHLCTNETIPGKGLRADWLVPASNTKWICSKTGVTPCISLKLFNRRHEFCIQVMIIPRIIYHPEEYVYHHQTLSVSRHIQKREPFTALTIATLLALGAAGTGAGVASLVKQNKRFHSLSIQVDEDLARTEQSISALEKSLRSLSEVVLQNRRALDLLVLQRGGLCAALEEECCVYADNTGVVRDTMAKLREGLEERKGDREGQQGWFDSWFNHSPWLTTLTSTLIGLIAMIVMALIFGPCILNKLASFVKSRLEKVNITVLEDR
ncbi:ENV1 protein, partial [Eudromia elegans]|nr:ENV1 protein [Eudromia elegans]